MKFPLFGILVLTLVSASAQACLVNDASGKWRGSVTSGIVLNASGTVVGSHSGTITLNPSGVFVGTRVSTLVTNARGESQGWIQNPSILDSGFHSLGYGADCSDDELAAARLLLL